MRAVCTFCTLLVSSGCDFFFPLNDPSPIDGGGDGRPGANPLCFGTFAPVCLTDPPTTTLDVSTVQSIETSSGCTPTTEAPTDVCVRAFSVITIGNVARVRAIGNRPLILIASGSIEIKGVLDASSSTNMVGVRALGPGQDPSTCSSTLPTGFGGASGGTSGALGGDGGGSTAGGIGSSASTTLGSPAFLHGGCAGGAAGNAVGGGGGGGIALVSPEISVDGVIDASGGGGLGGEGGATMRGGGGGGAGGMIVIDAGGVVISSGAFVIARGGGGGGGGGSVTNGNTGGNPDPQTTMPASGGSAASLAGTGGNGGVSGGGSSGMLGNSQGGGGGGGGTGLIRIFSPSVVADGTISPQAL